MASPLDLLPTAGFAPPASKNDDSDDVELRSLESKLQLLRIQRQLSSLKCEAFLAELESYQASAAARPPTALAAPATTPSTSASRRRSLDSAATLRRERRIQRRSSSGIRTLRRAQGPDERRSWSQPLPLGFAFEDADDTEQPLQCSRSHSCRR